MRQISIKQNFKRKLYSIYDYRLLDDTKVKIKNSAIVNHLVEAIECKKQVELLDYSSPHSKQVSIRVVELFALQTIFKCGHLIPFSKK